MLFSQLENITEGKNLQLPKDRPVTALLTDSRKALVEEGAVFFAIDGQHHDGHRFIPQLYELGIRQFVVEKTIPAPGPDASILQVASAIRALQQVAANHRSAVTAPVIAITGSNGKTIVKEWLFQLLSPEYKIAKNPASYNSQLGVPLSVWQIEPHHTLGIFEAGISTVQEMEHLQKVLRPSIGVFTNIGPAHDEGFKDLEEKTEEKLRLFRDSKVIVYCKDHTRIDQAITKAGWKGFSWGRNPEADVQVRSSGPAWQIGFSGETFSLQLPFSDQASIENCLHCTTVLLYLGYHPAEIQKRIAALRTVPMRLEIKEAINQCQIVDDTYNNDLAGLQVSLDFLAHQKQKSRKSVILSDMHQSGLPERALVRKIASLVAFSNADHFIGIGPVLFSHQGDFPAGSAFFRTTDEFLQQFDFNTLQNEMILIKGARVFAFEKIVNHLQRKVHGTVMEIDLGALVHNLHYFTSRLKPETKVMAMVKAFGYGSGSSEVANVLQYHRIAYLGVAYADEGVDLRMNNISLPIMVMNPAEESFPALVQYQLEPEIYNFRILQTLENFLQGQPFKIHIKLDTGMHRLGFDQSEIEALVSWLRGHPNLQVASIFSHLAGADESMHDAFSKAQARAFQAMADEISHGLQYKPLYHILNSSGILRLPEFQMDMVRLGIGLYGINPTSGHHQLKPVATLKTIISQIKQIPAGESIGYGRKGRADKDLTIATIAIGYADGFSRAFSQGVGQVMVHGKLAPVIGNVCMDMTMIDITGISANEGDEVIIFGKEVPIQDLAARINTIPYEILTSSSERIKRVFVAESI